MCVSAIVVRNDLSSSAILRLSTRTHRSLMKKMGLLINLCSITKSPSGGFRRLEMVIAYEVRENFLYH